jgi:hypothetical protein
MITQAGPQCDVCGNFILPLDPDERVNFFGVKGIKNELSCDNKCKKLLQEIGRDWHKLPAGPLKRAFEEAAK